MNRTTRLLLAGAFAVWAGAAGGCHAGGSPPRDTPARLRFTAIPDQNTTELQEKFKPFEQHLTRVLGVAVEYLPARDYQAAVEMFVNGDVGLAWYGGLTGVQARARVPGARAIAQGDGDAGFYSYFIAHRDTGLIRSDQFPAAMQKHAFTFGPEQSTSGRLMPEYFIRQHTGRAPQEFFRAPPGFSASHDRTLELVASGQYPTGVVNHKVYDERVRQQRLDPDVVRVIWQTPPYADYNWTARPNLDGQYGAGFLERLTRALLEIDDPALLLALPRARLVAASNAEYDAISAVARNLDMLR